MLKFMRGDSGVADFEANDSERNHSGHVLFGRVKEADYAKARVRVAIGDESDDDGHLVTDWLPMGGLRAGDDSEWHPLEVGEGVVVLSESGEVQNGVVIPAGFYDADHPAPGNKAGLWRKRFSNGAEISYDRDSGDMLLDATGDGSLTLKAGGCLIVLADGVVTIKAKEIVTDGRTRLNKGTRGVAFRGSRDSGGDTIIDGAGDVYV